MDPLQTLTAREKQVALRIGRGDTCREIANELHISPKTVDTHRLHLLKKLGIKRSVHLALLLVREHQMQANGQPVVP